MYVRHCGLARMALWHRCTQGANGSLPASRASIDSAIAQSSARSTRRASTHRSAATAVIMVVPLISARPSFGAKRMGSRPASLSASSAGMRRP